MSSNIMKRTNRGQKSEMNERKGGTSPKGMGRREDHGWSTLSVKFALWQPTPPGFSERIHNLCFHF